MGNLRSELFIAVRASSPLSLLIRAIIFPSMWVSSNRHSSLGHNCLPSNGRTSFLRSSVDSEHRKMKAMIKCMYYVHGERCCWQKLYSILQDEMFARRHWFKADQNVIWYLSGTAICTKYMKISSRLNHQQHTTFWTSDLTYIVNVHDLSHLKSF